MDSTELINTFKTQFKCITQDLIYFYRDDITLSEFKEIDTQPDQWCLFIAYNIQPGTVSVYISGSLLELKGNIAIWLPPFSIVEWRIKPCHLQWHGFISNSKLPKHIPHQALVFDYKLATLPNCKAEIFNLFLRATTLTLIEREKSPTPLVQNLKISIQNRFTEDLLISELSNEFNVSHEYIIRVFKKTFGIAPIYLRNRLRIFSSLIPLIHGKDVTTVATNSGFSDICRFSKQFSKIFKIPPAHFQKLKME